MPLRCVAVHGSTLAVPSIATRSIAFATRDGVWLCLCITSPCQVLLSLTSCRCAAPIIALTSRDFTMLCYTYAPKCCAIPMHRNAVLYLCTEMLCCSYAILCLTMLCHSFALQGNAVAMPYFALLHSAFAVHEYQSDTVPLLSRAIRWSAMPMRYHDWLIIALANACNPPARKRDLHRH